MRHFGAELRTEITRSETEVVVIGRVYRCRLVMCGTVVVAVGASSVWPTVQVHCLGVM